MLQRDSVARIKGVDSAHVQPTKAKKSSQPTPAQVLKWLPKDATPAQQDSAIQANIKPSKISWSNRPDTLHLPGHPIGKSFRDINLPQYYKESFFSKDSLFHPELAGGRVGVPGDPVPYAVANDYLITSILLGCFILATIALSKSKPFIIRQAKSFFYVPRGETTSLTETAGEIRSQFFFVLQTCLLLSLILFFYTRTLGSETFVVEHYQVIGIYAIGFFAYYVFNAFVYWFANWVFFDWKKNDQWMKTKLFLVSMEGVILFPIVMLLAYFDLSVSSAVIYSIVIVSLVKILTLYKLSVIFFRQRGSFLQIILYFCALEVIPMFVMWGVFDAINDYLRINY